MKLRLSLDNLRPTIASTLAAGMLVGSLASAAPALAAPEAPKRIDRNQTIKRAKNWTRKGVPYSQVGYKDGYRRDCSGFLAYSWNIPENIVTWNVPLVAKRITKNQLRPGDVLLNARGGVGGNHVVIFEKWANKSRTKYWLLEQTGANGVERAVRRQMPYPYKFDKSLYKPYRYKGMESYFKAIPAGSRQPVKGYELNDAEKAKRKAAWRKTAKLRREARKAAAERKRAQLTAEARTSAAGVKPGTKAAPAAATKRAQRGGPGVETNRPDAANRSEPVVRNGLIGALIGWLGVSAQ